MSYTKSNVNEMVQAKLAESNIDLVEQRKLKIKGLLPAETVKVLSNKAIVRPSIKIPYFEINGKPMPYFRLRLLGQHIGFGEGPPKYLQPKNTAPRFYLPPMVDWKTISQDVDEPLYITEGEFKSICGCRYGFPTVGLGGVYSWKSTKLKQPRIKDFELFQWVGREVYLVFDSDLATNLDVQRALLSLANELTSLGAVPFIVYLTNIPDLGKAGLDDWLIYYGQSEFETLIQEAVSFATSRELWQLNQEVSYIKDPGLVMILNEGRTLSASDFVNHAYANRYYFAEAVKDGRTVLTKKPLAAAWLKWEHRRELKKITYAPGKDKLVDGMYNNWSTWGAEPVSGDISPWHKLLDYIFEDDLDARTWFERWCAIQFQQPGVKLYTATAIWSVYQGTGKSIIGYTLMKIFGNNALELKQRDLHSSFNEWSVNKQFVMGDEITGSDKRAESDLLKGLITQHTVTVNKKFVPSYTIPDTINYYFTSNHPDAFFLEDTDRRYFIYEIKKPPMPDSFYLNEYDPWLHGSGPSHLFHYFLNYDLADFNAKSKALVTEAKLNMVYDVKSDLGTWVHQLIESPEQVLVLGQQQLKSDLWTTQQLLSLYDPDSKTRVTSNGLGRELKRARLFQLPVLRTPDGPKRFYAIRNIEKWKRASTNEIVDHYLSFFGQKPKKY